MMLGLVMWERSRTKGAVRRRSHRSRGTGDPLARVPARTRRARGRVPQAARHPEVARPRARRRAPWPAAGFHRHGLGPSIPHLVTRGGRTERSDLPTREIVWYPDGGAEVRSFLVGI